MSKGANPRVSDFNGIPDILQHDISSIVLGRGMTIKERIELAATSKEMNKLYNPTFAPQTRRQFEDKFKIIEVEGKFVKRLVGGSNIVNLDLSRIKDISSEELMSVLDGGLVNLKYLNLAGCGNLKDDALEKIVSSSLESIKLFNCRKVGGGAVKGLINKNKNLVHLKLGGCVEVTDAAFVGLEEGALSNLTHISLSRCKKITDTAVLAIASKTISGDRSSLFDVNLSGCTKLTDVVPAEFMKKPFYLNRLNVAECGLMNNTTSGAVHQLSNAYERVTNGRIGPRRMISITYPDNANNSYYQHEHRQTRDPDLDLLERLHNEGLIKEKKLPNSAVNRVALHIVENDREYSSDFGL